MITNAKKVLNLFASAEQNETTNDVIMERERIIHNIASFACVLLTLIFNYYSVHNLFITFNHFFFYFSHNKKQIDIKNDFEISFL